jgi:hypothetical protein
MSIHGKKPFYENDQSVLEPSTAAPSSRGQSISEMASVTSKSVSAIPSATSTDDSSQSGISDNGKAREAFDFHFSAM